jgi:hypothetical protein
MINEFIWNRVDGSGRFPEWDTAPAFSPGVLCKGTKKSSGPKFEPKPPHEHEAGASGTFGMIADGTECAIRKSLFC